MKFQYRPESGNALWFVLLAVALLGFLTAVVSRTGSSVEQTGNVEQSRIKASALLRYTQSVEATIQQMIMNGVSESDLDFGAIGADHDNPNCSTDLCAVFGAGGGGISNRSAADVLSLNNFKENWRISSGNKLFQFGCDDETESCSELLLLLPGIPKSVCLEINKLQDITNPSGDAPQQNALMIDPPFTGIFEVNAGFIGGENAAGESPEVKGKAAGCIQEKGREKNYVFYQVLIAR